MVKRNEVKGRRARPGRIQIPATRAKTIRTKSLTDFKWLATSGAEDCTHCQFLPTKVCVAVCTRGRSKPPQKPIWAQMFLHVVKHSIYSNPTKRRYQRRNKGCAWDTDLIAPVRRSWFIGHDRDSASTIDFALTTIPQTWRNMTPTRPTRKRKRADRWPQGDVLPNLGKVDATPPITRRHKAAATCSHVSAR